MVLKHVLAVIVLLKFLVLPTTITSTILLSVMKQVGHVSNWTTTATMLMGATEDRVRRSFSPSSTGLKRSPMVVYDMTHYHAGEPRPLVGALLLASMRNVAMTARTKSRPGAPSSSSTMSRKTINWE